MTMRSLTKALLVLLAVLPTGPAGAQLADGDLLLAGSGLAQEGLILALRPSNGQISTLLRLPGTGRIVQSVGMGPDNRSWVFSWFDFGQNTGFVGRLQGIGVWTTIASFPPADGPQAHDLAVDGSVLAATRAGALVAVASGQPLRTLFRGPRLLNAVALDPRSGFPVVGEFGPSGPGRLLEIDTIHGRARTLSPAIPALRSLAADRHCRALFVGSAQSPHVFRLDPGGISTLTSLDMGNALAVADDLSLFGVGNGRVLYHVDSSGRVLQTHSLATRLTAVKGLAVHGTRRLGGVNPLRAGNPWRIELSSRRPADAGRPYVFLPALTCFPGLDIPPGRHLGLNLDALSEIAFRGGLPVLSGHIGFLDPNGEAVAALGVPVGLRGLRVHFAGLILDPGRPWPQSATTITNTATVLLP